jgi:large subunit ribosomal protein L2
MGKRIITQARGRGGPTYRVRKKAFKLRLKFPKNLEGQGKIIKLLKSAGHSAPIAKVKYSKGTFFIPAPLGIFENQEISFGSKAKIEPGNILQLKDIPLRTEVFQVESRPGDGGTFIKSAGSKAVVNKKQTGKVVIVFPSKKEKTLNEKCRAIVGVIAGDGRLDKPFVKAGKKFHLKKAKSKLWPRTGALKMNAIDHPFGSGRGKNPKSKIAKRNAPPGQKVGLLRPKRTGRKKR